MFGLAYRDLLPAFAVEALDEGPEQYGLMLSMIGLGSIVGTFALAAQASSRKKGAIIMAMAVALGASIVLLSFSGTLAIALVVLFAIGFVTAFRGRVASFHMLTSGMHPVGTLLFGFIAEATDIRIAFRISGVALIGIIGVLGLWRGDVRRLA